MEQALPHIERATCNFLCLSTLSFYFYNVNKVNNGALSGIIYSKRVLYLFFGICYCLLANRVRCSCKSQNTRIGFRRAQKTLAQTREEHVNRAGNQIVGIHLIIGIFVHMHSPLISLVGLFD